MESLCKDLIWYIGFKLENKDLFSLSVSCKKFYNSIFLSELFWRLKYERDFCISFLSSSSISSTNNKEEKGLWKKKYVKRYICEEIREALGITGEREIGIKGEKESEEEIEKEKICESIYLKEEIIIHTYNYTRNLPKNIKYLPYLKSIRITNGFLNYFPDSVFIPNLQSLNLCYNYISVIPSSLLLTLKNLKHLYLAENMIKVFPKELCEIDSLEKLDLSNNCINNIPTEIYKLRNLETLDLSRNYIVHVPIELSLLKNLRYLSLCRNYIEYFPEELKRLNLDEIYVSENKLVSMSSGQEIVAYQYS